MSWLQQAIALVDRTGGRGLFKAASSRGSRVVGEPKGQNIDPFSMFNSGDGYQYRPSMLSYDALRSVAYGVPVIRAILIRRIAQLQAFAKTPDHDYDIGFRVSLRDSSKEPSRAAKKKIAEMEDFIRFCGSPDVRDRALMGDNFRVFMGKMVRDSLIFDQMNFQIVPRLNGKPYEMVAMPAMQMRVKRRRLEEAKLFTGEFGDLHIERVPADDPRFVQVYWDQVIADFTPRELAWGVRNPVTDIDHFMYGWSELENLIHQLTAMLYAEEYNRRFFSQGSAVKGILNLKGNIPQRTLHQFRKEWHALISGVRNAFRTPVVSAEEVQWISMHQSNKDMEFSAWLDFLIKIACSHFLIDPSELGFHYGNAGQSSTLRENDKEAQIKRSKDNGIRPILNLLSELLTTHVIWPFDEDFQLKFTGLDSEDEDKKIAKAKDSVMHFKMVDEVRADFDLQPMPNGSGKVILNSVWQQAMMQSKQDDDADSDVSGMFGDDGEEEKIGPPFTGPFGRLFADASLTIPWDAKQGMEMGKSMRRARVKRYEIEL